MDGSMTGSCSICPLLMITCGILILSLFLIQYNTRNTTETKRVFTDGTWISDHRNWHLENSPLLSNLATLPTTRVGTFKYARAMANQQFQKLKVR